MDDEINELREARTKGVAIYHKFCLDKDFHGNHLFLFFESEDGKYYIPRIIEYSNYDYSKLVQYECGGKDEVIKAYNMISKDGFYENVKKAFFVDKDFIPMAEIPTEIYQTPCYSIENFYTSSNVFEKILLREFMLSPISQDFKKCARHYIASQDTFHKNILLINAWLYCQRQIEKQGNRRLVRINKFKISKLFKAIAIDNVEIASPVSISSLEVLFPEHYEVSDGQLKDAINSLNMSDQQQTFRGKFELEFLVKVIDDLIRKNKDGDYFTEKKEYIYLNPFINSLSAFSDFAETPQCLIDFIKRYNVAS